jgi:hypothetical protein
MKILVTGAAGFSFGRAATLNLLRKSACTETGSLLLGDGTFKGAE